MLPKPAHAFFFLLLTPLLALADGSPQEVAAQAKQFLSMADRVNGQEPTLYPNSAFADLQEMTLKYQRYAGSQEAGDFKRVFVIPPGAVTMAQLEKAYVKYAREATELSDTLIPRVALHISMINRPSYEKKYRAKYAGVLKSLFPDSQGKLQEFQVFDCDYTTQPTDAFWYTFHATRLLDAYATALFGPKWTTRSAELRKAGDIKSLAEMQKSVEPGPPPGVPSLNEMTNINEVVRTSTQMKKTDCPEISP